MTPSSLQNCQSTVTKPRNAGKSSSPLDELDVDDVAPSRRPPSRDTIRMSDYTTGNASRQCYTPRDPKLTLNLLLWVPGYGMQSEAKSSHKPRRNSSELLRWNMRPMLSSDGLYIPGPPNPRKVINLRSIYRLLWKYAGISRRRTPEETRAMGPT